MLQHAFKEWAVICRALAKGKQAILLRKGGIAETGGEFTVEHQRFWLYPTYVHQQREGVIPRAQPLLDEAEAGKPPDGVVRLTHFAEVAGVFHVLDLLSALKLAGLHLWSEETVEKRFNYRRPGLYVIPVRVFRATKVIELPETPHYAGCRSWVDLEQPLDTEGATPVLEKDAFRQILHTLDLILLPPAYA